MCYHGGCGGCRAAAVLCYLSWPPSYADVLASEKISSCLDQTWTSPFSSQLEFQQTSTIELCLPACQPAASRWSMLCLSRLDIDIYNALVQRSRSLWQVVETTSTAKLMQSISHRLFGRMLDVLYSAQLASAASVSKLYRSIKIQVDLEDIAAAACRQHLL